MKEGMKLFSLNLAIFFFFSSIIMMFIFDRPEPLIGWWQLSALLLIVYNTA